MLILPRVAGRQSTQSGRNLQGSAHPSLPHHYTDSPDIG